VLFERMLAFLHKQGGSVGFLLTQAFAFLVGLRFWQAEAEDDDEDGRASAEPEQGPPPMADCVNEGAREDGGEEVAKRITLLKHTGYNATSGSRAVFEGWGG